MKRILFILPKTQQGGAETQMLYLLKGLNRSKFNVYLGLLYENDQLKKEFGAIKDLKIINFNKKNKFDVFVYFRIAKFIRQNQIDLICSFMGNHHAYVPALLTSKVIAIGGIRNTSARDIRGFKKFREFALNKVIMKLAPYTLISNSYSAREAYVKGGVSSNDIEVIPNGVDYSLFSRGKANLIVREFGLKNKFVMGIVARLVPTKNHKDLILGFKKLLKYRKDLVLLIVGDGPERADLKSFAEELGLSKFVIFTGNRRDVADILAAMDLFVFPSKYPEGWPNVIGEAMAAGVPVVTYLVGDVKHIITNQINGIITKDNIDTFMTEVAKLMMNAKKRKLLGKNAKKTIREKFSVEKMVQRYEQAFIKLDEGRR